MNLPDVYRGPDPAQPIDVRAVPVGNDRLDLRGVLSTFRRRIWLFTFVAATVFAIAVFISITQTPVYTAASRVILDVQGQNVAPTPGDKSAPQTNTSDSAIESEVEIIRSRALAAEVVKQLNLTQDPAFNLELAGAEKGAKRNVVSDVQQQIVKVIPQDARNAPAPGAENEAVTGDPVVDGVVDVVLEGVTAQRVGLTYAIDIGFTTGDPRKAALIANTYATLYTSYNLQQKVVGNRQAVTLLQGRIEDLRKQAELDTAAVQQYRIANNLLSSSGASLTEQEISAYNQQVTSARAEAAADQASLNTARNQLRSGSAGDDVGEALSSPVVQGLRSQRAQISARVADLQSRYGPRHPDIITANRQLADIDAQIQAEINRVISNLDAKAQVSRQRLASLQGSLGNARGALRSNNQAMVRLDELERKATASQSLYESYLTRLGQTSAQEGTLRPEARIISPARVPSSPSAPNVPLYLALGLMLGLGGGLLSAFLAEMMSSSFTTAEDIEQRLGRTYLGSIPTVTSVAGAGASPIDSLVANQRSAYAEAFRGLRTALQYAGHDEPKVIVITSSLPQEGKSTTSICLARSSALAGRKTLLIDADLRRRGVNRLIGKAARDGGIIDVISGRVGLEGALIVDEATGLHVLPVGKAPADSDHLLTGELMDNLLKELREAYDTIIVDCPPVLPVAEGRSLATKADAVIFAVRWRKTAEQAVRAAFRLLPRDKVRLAGVVLTRVDIRKQARYGYGDAGYYYNQYKDYYS